MNFAAVAGHSARRGHPKLPPQTAPAFASSPAIIGTPMVGAESFYTSGVYTGNPTPTVTRQWTLDGVDIGGATAATYTPVSGDATHLLRVREIATNALGSTSSNSASVIVAAAGPGVTWLFSDGATFNLAPSSSVSLASVPGGVAYTTSPDLLPGQTLSLAGSTLSLVNDSTLPTADSPRDVVIEVMDSAVSPMIRRVTSGRAKDYPSAAYPSGRWNTIMSEAIEGDVFEIAPGAIHAQFSDLNNYHSNSLNPAMLVISKPGLTLRNMTGRGRWSLYPDRSLIASDRNGIVIYKPGASGDMTGRGSFWLEGFAFDNWGADAGVRCMPGVEVPSSYANLHTSLTLKNFKIGRRDAGERCNSGISGGAETLLVEDGHVYDCGDGSGLEHNVYISARTMTWKGVRNSRTRGWPAVPYATFAAIEGHLFKLSAVTGTIEGCTMEGSDNGDHTFLLQMKAGGNWTVRGNLLIDSPWSNNARGSIMMLREWSGDNTAPNHEWWAGVEGNSLLFEKNVVVGHMCRPILSFFEQDLARAGEPMRPAAGGAWAAETRLNSLTVRDNIAMVASAMRDGIQPTFPIPGWAAQDATTRPLWIYQDPNGGTHWTGRGNTVLTYDQTEAAFENRLLKVYTLAAGAAAASGGTVATQRFVYPHGYEARSDALKGLG
jgi:hypothetical protein